MNQDRIPIKNIMLQSAKRKSNKENPDRFNLGNHIYVRKSKGTFQRLRRYVACFLLSLFFFLPWFSYNERQAILLDIGNQQVNFFCITIYPQDLKILFFFLLIILFSLFFLTMFVGRIWCGYFCPQTIWSFIYIWFEEKFEGSANKRRKQDSSVLTINIIIRKITKHVFWILIAFLTGLTFLGYFLPIKDLISNFFSFNSSFLVLLFSVLTYINSAWMRSIICIHVCPYARFQSVIFDKNTLMVAYDVNRGENRGKRSRQVDSENLGLGDCINCNLCVQVCPTGIDIRDGLQYECINCGACIDACNKTMSYMGYKPNLISYITKNRLLSLNTKIIKTKLFSCIILLLFMVGLFLLEIINLKPIGLTVLRDRNQLFKSNYLGEIENTYILKIINKTKKSKKYYLDIKGLNNISWYGKRLVQVRPGEVYNVPLSLGIYPDRLNLPVTKIQFIISDDEDFNVSVESRFIKGF
ncbi:cytochrome c oxidase accessory protein CcoG [Candidatus Photodesmus anomalopis]|uniref:4Fe-4S binding protein n=1 Tax=Candidatus Photodesmus katoptron Akat1 TaxID=1236703 RepID=S3DHY5_9GAMM|nr:cytochrome c oxidase accessory protein CcoG [Candidatus Photodesmus katoptron]EPE37280.1 4Fe-4S binding protein [Candidatus Photodesmus katoptron Akat1]